jgi:hypothetical protein
MLLADTLIDVGINQRIRYTGNNYNSRKKHYNSLHYWVSV